MSSTDPRFTAHSRSRLLHALGLVVVAAAVMLVGFAAIIPAIAGGFEELAQAGPASFLAIAAIATLQIGGVIGVGLLALGRLTPSELGWRAEGLATEVLIGLAGVAILVVLMVESAILFGVGTTELIDTMTAWSPKQRLLFLCIGITAALTEETLFRGYLQPELTSRLGVAPGILLTAAIFSLYHLNFRPVSLLSKFLFGVALGGMRQRRGLLIAPTIAHALFWAVAGFA